MVSWKISSKYGRVENENADLDENSENENLIQCRLMKVV